MNENPRPRGARPDAPSKVPKKRRRKSVRLKSAQPFPGKGATEPPQDPSKVTVVVIGAGIAGLTAAHELAERRFDVWVVEKETGLNPGEELDDLTVGGHDDLVIGGLARTQYVLKPHPEKDAGAEFPVTPVTRLAAPRMVRIKGDTLTATDRWRIEQFAKKGYALPGEEFEIQLWDKNDDDDLVENVCQLLSKDRFECDIRKMRDPDEDKGEPIKREVADLLEGMPRVPPDLVDVPTRLVPVSFHEEREGDETFGKAPFIPADLLAEVRERLREFQNEVVIFAPPGAVGERLPGEHGFRFFPAYYRHVFDTLSRIPVYEVRNGKVDPKRATSRRVMDNITSTRAQAFVDGGTSPILYPREPPRSLSGLAQVMWEMFVRRGYDVRDVQQFVLRTIRFMITGPKRRQKELEDLSWWEYLQGYDPETGVTRFKYRTRFAADVDFSPRVLAAADAEWGDARTSGSTFVQLLLNQVLESDYVDGTLNGPTSEAWLRHWKAHLENLGVTFVSAKLARMVGAGERVLPEFEIVCPKYQKTLDDLEALVNDPENHVYFVMALDALAAERLTGTLAPPYRVGVAKELERFSTWVAASPRGGVPARPRELATYGEEEWDRFQTLSGIQYFFKNEFKLYSGHVYYLDAPWGLSSISQGQFWQKRPEKGDAFRGVLSVDIGEWNQPSPRHHDKSAWECTGDEVAAETWHQIVDAFEPYWKRHRSREEPALIMPDWYHLDRNIDLDKKINETPFLIPIVGDWKNRPGGEPWDPGVPSRVRGEPPRRFLWQAPHGGYRVHWGQWLFAGTYMKHFTRMTTMEAANESGRHAVNAILDHLWEEARGGRRAPDGEPDDGTLSATGRDPLDPDTAYVPTPYGDYAHIWDIEKYELEDTKRLQELDDWLCERGYPHVWDLLGVEVLPSWLSYVPSAGDLGLPELKEIRRALARLSREKRRDRRGGRKPGASSMPPELERMLELIDTMTGLG